jgi:hypothetical protein
MLQDLGVKVLVYLDDILILGNKNDLNKAKLIILASDFNFNKQKCHLTPTRRLTYLGIEINLDNSTLILTDSFTNKIRK